MSDTLRRLEAMLRGGSVNSYYVAGRFTATLRDAGGRVIARSDGVSAADALNRAMDIVAGVPAPVAPNAMPTFNRKG